jgi:hypothetical protein
MVALPGISRICRPSFALLANPDGYFSFFGARP